MTDLANVTVERPTPAKIARPPRAPVQPATVTATQLGEHLGLTRQRIGALADTEHVIERLPNGRFDQDDCRLRYLRWLRETRTQRELSRHNGGFNLLHGFAVGIFVLVQVAVEVEGHLDAGR